MKDPALGKTPEERKKLLNSGGLTIQTTIDLRDQRAADQSVQAHVYPTDRRSAGWRWSSPAPAR